MLLTNNVLFSLYVSNLGKLCLPSKLSWFCVISAMVIIGKLYPRECKYSTQPNEVSQTRRKY